VPQSVLRSVPSGSASSRPYVRVAAVLGPDTLSSKCLSGVLLDVPLPPDVPDFRVLRGARVVLFSEALESHHSTGMAGVDFCGATSANSISDSGDVARKHALVLQALGITVVACRTFPHAMEFEQHAHSFWL
jgi:hypothetical protein